MDPIISDTQRSLLVSETKNFLAFQIFQTFLISKQMASLPTVHQYHLFQNYTKTGASTLYFEICWPSSVICRAVLIPNHIAYIYNHMPCLTETWSFLLGFSSLFSFICFPNVFPIAAHISCKFLTKNGYSCSIWYRIQPEQYKMLSVLYRVVNREEMGTSHMIFCTVQIIFYAVQKYFAKQICTVQNFFCKVKIFSEQYRIPSSGEICTVHTVFCTGRVFSVQFRFYSIV